MILKKGKKIADSSKRDFEIVPLTENIDDYFNKEVKPYNPDAWYEVNKIKVGYEIPFTRLFYEFKSIAPSSDVLERIEQREEKLMSKLRMLLEKGGE